MENLKDFDDLENWAKDCKKLVDNLYLPDYKGYDWYWYFLEGFTPSQAVRDYKLYLKQNSIIK